jgi:hypothetical protein
LGPAKDASDTPGPAVYINLTDTAGGFANTWFYTSHRKSKTRVSASLQRRRDKFRA